MELQFLGATGTVTGSKYADDLLVESTCGNRTHQPSDALEKLAEVINRTAARAGVLAIPAFAVGRAQSLLHAIYLLKRRGRIHHLAVHLDSPVAIHGEDVPVRAEVACPGNLSAHADAGESLAWLRGFSQVPRQTFVTHGEPAAADAPRVRIERELGWPVTMPDYLQTVELT